MNKGLIVRIAILTTTAAMGLGTMYYIQHDVNDNSEHHALLRVSRATLSEFHKEETPATNMLIVLKVLNNSALCDASDNGWYEEVEDCLTMLTMQIQANEQHEDPIVNEYMRLQQQLVEELQTIKNDMSEASINRLEQAYREYHDYYDQVNVMKGGSEYEDA